MERGLAVSLTADHVQRMEEGDVDTLREWLGKCGDQPVIVTVYRGTQLVIPTYCGPITPSTGSVGGDGRAFKAQSAREWLAVVDWALGGVGQGTTCTGEACAANPLTLHQPRRA
jgi:hypothetical protein